MSIFSPISDWFSSRRPPQARIRLRYFEDVLPVELDAINKRRNNIAERRPKAEKRPPVQPLKPAEHGIEPPSPAPRTARKLSPDPDKLFPLRGGFGGGEPPVPPRPADPDNPDYDKTRPRPVPINVAGLAFSGGGIRSAAVCLGALQALQHNRRMDSVDYLSSVSGGGYIGACLSAAMSDQGGAAFPFGDDVSDSAAVAHLRNYSNYLLPRGHSGIRNAAEAAVVILRGLVANAILVLATLIGFALLTKTAFPELATLRSGSFVPRILDRITASKFSALVGPHPFALTIWLVVITAVVLVLWAVLRSTPRFDALTGDTRSFLLSVSKWLFGTAVVMALLDAQPLAIELLTGIYSNLAADAGLAASRIHKAFGVLVAFGGTVSSSAAHSGIFSRPANRRPTGRRWRCAPRPVLSSSWQPSCCRWRCGSPTCTCRPGPSTNGMSRRRWPLSRRMTGRFLRFCSASCPPGWSSCSSWRSCFSLRSRSCSTATGIRCIVSTATASARLSCSIRPQRSGRSRPRSTT